MKKLLEIFKGDKGEFSSKRFVGIIGAFVLFGTMAHNSMGISLYTTSSLYPLGMRTRLACSNKLLIKIILVLRVLHIRLPLGSRRQVGRVLNIVMVNCIRLVCSMHSLHPLSIRRRQLPCRHIGS